MSTARSPTIMTSTRESPVARTTQTLTAAELSRATDAIGRITEAFSSRVVGQTRVRNSLLVTLLSEGHILLESVPGLAKTLAASTLAQSVDADFSRIQCTPDLLPSDIIGTQVYDPRHHEFETQLGPVHHNFVLLDEINRASAKTQSALLESMQERQTSIAGTIHKLPAPFMVMATQNPIDEEGTYVLPHAQMDRFLLKEVVDYPGEEDELEVLDRVATDTLGQHATDLDAVVDLAQVTELQALVRRVYVDTAVRRYVVALIRATRNIEQVLGPEMASYVEIGASPRGSIAFFQAARAMAVVQGRHYVIPEDVRELRHAVLRHRLHLTFEALADRVAPETIIDALFRAVPTP
jgi:MoxR-like ATPase